ncbi:MAG: hypothetical protein Q9228_003456 [Teloschistes exilis]
MSLAEMLEASLKQKWYQEDYVSSFLNGQARPPPPLKKSMNLSLNWPERKCFRLMDLPYDVRRRLYDIMYPTHSTVYLTTGSQAIRYPPPVDFRVNKGFLNLLRCCKTIKTEIYQVLYGTNKFVLNPELPDLKFSKKAPHLPKAEQLERYWKKLESSMKAGGNPAIYRAMGILPPDQERGEATKCYLWYSRECFLKRMSPATCAITRELQIFIGDAECSIQQVWPRLVPEQYHYPLCFFSRLVVASIPLLHCPLRPCRVAGQVQRICARIPMLSHQLRQRNLLREVRRWIARARVGRGVTVWDNLGESSCGGFNLEVGIEGFSYENLPENMRWLTEYVHHHVEGHPVRALPSK